MLKSEGDVLVPALDSGLLRFVSRDIFNICAFSEWIVVSVAVQEIFVLISWSIRNWDRNATSSCFVKVRCKCCTDFPNGTVCVCLSGCVFVFVFLSMHTSDQITRASSFSLSLCLSAFYPAEYAFVSFAVVPAADGWLRAQRQMAKPHHPLGNRGGGALALLSKHPTWQLLPWHGICHFQHLRWEQSARL